MGYAVTYRQEVRLQQKTCASMLCQLKDCNRQMTFKVIDIGKVKGKVFPYSLPSVGPGADPGVQAVSPQVT